MKHPLTLARTILFLLLACCPTANAQEMDEWTVLYYGGSDNDSEESFVPDMARLRAALPSEGGLELFCLVDRSPRYSTAAGDFGEDFAGTRLFRIGADGVERLEGGELFPEIESTGDVELNSADAVVLRNYLRWAKHNHPARRYALVFYTHGNGPFWCPDETDGGDHLHTAELTDVLGEQDSLDLVVFDVCNMAGLENAYQWRPAPGKFGIGHMVATPMAGFPFPWQRVYARIRPEGGQLQGQPCYRPADLDAETFARLVVEETENSRLMELASGPPARVVEMIQGEAMTAVDLSRVGAVKAAVDLLAMALAGSEDDRLLLTDLSSPESDGRAIRYSGQDVDVYDLALRLRDGASDDAVFQAAEKVLAATDAAVISSYGLARYDERGGFLPGNHGLYLVLPDLEQKPAALWRRSAYYLPWSVTDNGRTSGGYLFCADGAEVGNGRVENWFELLMQCAPPQGVPGLERGY